MPERRFKVNLKRKNLAELLMILRVELKENMDFGQTYFPWVNQYAKNMVGDDVYHSLY